MSEKLLPCPFCGSAPRKDDSAGVELICCDRCEIAFSCNSFDDGVLERQWNRRASPWRDFRDERPQAITERVLCCWYDDGGFNSHCRVGYLSDLENAANEGYIVFWQPLPSPPTPEEIERAKGETK